MLTYNLLPISFLLLWGTLTKSPIFSCLPPVVQMNPFVGCGKYPDLNYLSSLFGLSSPQDMPVCQSCFPTSWSAQYIGSAAKMDCRHKQAAELNLFIQSLIKTCTAILSKIVTFQSIVSAAGAHFSNFPTLTQSWGLRKGEDKFLQD